MSVFFSRLCGNRSQPDTGNCSIATGCWTFFSSGDGENREWVEFVQERALPWIWVGSLSSHHVLGEVCLQAPLKLWMFVGLI